MTKIIFKNLEKSEIAREAASVRIQGIVEKFPELIGHRIQVTLSMENSPHQPGPDLFTVKLFIDGKRYRSVVIEKSSSNLYTALADVVDHALERLNRYGDKVRVRMRKSGAEPLVKVEESVPSSDYLDG